MAEVRHQTFYKYRHRLISIVPTTNHQKGEHTMDKTEKKYRVPYKGISNIIRKAIKAGTLSGEITISKVREILPLVEKWKGMPDTIITGSLAYLAEKNEIVDDRGTFRVKQVLTISSTLSKQMVLIMGQLISLKKSESGETIAMVVVDTLEYN